MPKSHKLYYHILLTAITLLQSKSTGRRLTPYPSCSLFWMESFKYTNPYKIRHQPKLHILHKVIKTYSHGGFQVHSIHVDGELKIITNKFSDHHLYVDVIASYLHGPESSVITGQ